jgi:para-aminobenzoate synthetase / 4-amino-4-deoxychorismate lyase
VSVPVITRAILQTDHDRWEWFREPSEIIQVTADAAAVPAALERIEELVERTGRSAVGFLTYEAATAYGLATSTSGPLPMLCFGLFSRVEERRPEPPVYGRGYAVGSWTAAVAEDEYRERIERIRSFLAAGESYQINYTFPLSAPFSGDELGFFRDMCTAQGGSYAAFLELSHDTESYSILSASPELFLERQGDRITSLPMKGTARRGTTRDADAQAARELRSSPKERAENLMITDMIRNDLGRIAFPGSVCVPQLFSVQRYPRVLQMVSRVEARSDVDLATLMSAMFPCASITGAPKHRTMELIRDLEGRYRGVYTGTIGVIRPGRRLRFNVAIRTVVLDRNRGQAEFGVGGGIVWDSSAEGEYRECATKAAILSVPDPPVTLLETLRWNPRRGATLLTGHLRRLQESFRFFFDPFEPPGSPAGRRCAAGMTDSTGHEGELLNGDQLDRLIAEAVAQADAGAASGAASGATPDADSGAAPGATHEADSDADSDADAGVAPGGDDRDWRVRLLVGNEIRVEVSPLISAEDILGPRRDDEMPLRRVALAGWPVDRRSPWLHHKTTNRKIYQEHLTAHPDADDVLLYNEGNHLTESCFASILVERVTGAGEAARYLATPPIGDGLLPGVFREYLLSPPPGTVPWTPGMLPVVEEPVPLDALEAVYRGEAALYLVNSVRGWMRARLLHAPRQR